MPYILFNDPTKKLCSLICCLHKLNSSNTLIRNINKLSDWNHMSVYEKIHITSLLIYCSTNIGKMKYYLKRYILLLHNYSGASPYLYLYNIYIPIIYKLFPFDFDVICEEIYVDNMYVIRNAYCEMNIFKSKLFNYEMKSLIFQLPILHSMDKFNFNKCIILETENHSVVCVKVNERWLVLDNGKIYDVNKYISANTNITIRNTNERTIDDLNLYMHSYRFVSEKTKPIWKCIY